MNHNLSTNDKYSRNKTLDWLQKKKYFVLAPSSTSCKNIFKKMYWKKKTTTKTTYIFVIDLYPKYELNYSIKIVESIITKFYGLNFLILKKIIIKVTNTVRFEVSFSISLYQILSTFNWQFPFLITNRLYVLN